MKKLSNSRKALNFLLFMVTFTISCSKTDTPKPPPTPVPVVPAPYLNASLSKDTAWYRGTETCSFSSDGVVKYNGSSAEITNPLVFSDITAPVNIQLTATKTVNGVVSPTTTKNLKIQVYSENKTNICKNPIWIRGITEKSNTLSSANEVPASYTTITTGLEGWIFEFLTNNTYRLTIPGTGTFYPKYYNFQSNDTKITIENTILDIETSTSTSLVITMVQQVIDGTTGLPIPNQWVKKRIFHSK